MPNTVPRVQSPDRIINQLQDNIIGQLNAVLRLPIISGSLLSSVVLASGANSINHGLGRTLIGWFPVRWHGSWAEVYDTQDTSTTTNTTLNLVASAPVTIDLWVF